MRKPYQDSRGGGDRGSKSFGGPRFWKPGFGDRDARSAMHPATCNECGARCEVPFKPNGRKPIYCSNCFKKDDSRDTRSFGDKRSYEGSRGNKDQYADQLREINSKLDAIIRALEA